MCRTMKVETKVLSDGRLSIALVENDGSPVASRELDREAAINLFARWALVFIPTTGSNQVTFGGGSKDILLALADAKPSPHPEKSTAAEGSSEHKSEIINHKSE